VKKTAFSVGVMLLLFALLNSMAFAEVDTGSIDEPGQVAKDAEKGIGAMGISLKIDPADTPEEITQSLQILLMMTVLTLVPSAFIMTTSFMRIMIVFGFLRRALGTQTAPANQVLAGMSLFLTIFIMAPVWNKIHADAIKPYIAKEITQAEAFKIGAEPLRAFMARQTGEEELALFVELRKLPENPENPTEIPMDVLIPAFMISELKTAFQMGFLIYLPFLVIDLVIASTLMSMGMMMLPPMMISLPIKILFFVLADGWTMLIRGLVNSFSV